MHKDNQRFSIRQELEKMRHENEQSQQQGNSVKASPSSDSQRKYHGLNMAWKDVVMFSLLILVTSVYQVRAEAAAELTPVDFDDISSGMLLSFDKNSGEYASLELVSAEYSADIFGMLATVTIKQNFRNPSDQWVSEGVYAFPVASQSAVYGMKLIIGKRIIEGEIHEKEEAIQIYEQAKLSGQTASIVKQYRPNLFTTDVANIGPQETISVEITYQQTLHYDSGHFDFRIPLAIKPRYVPNADNKPLPTSGNVSHNNSRSININLDAGFELAELQSLNHDIDVVEEFSMQHIQLSDNALFDANDFVLRWQPLAGSEPKAAYFSEYKDGHEYALLMMLPPQSTEKLTQPRNITYIIDTSGSMHGTALDQAKDALLYAMSELESDSYFNIIDFDSTAKPLFTQSQQASPDNIGYALDFIEKLNSDGGTNMAPALEIAMQSQNIIPNRLNQIIFITDGSVGNEAQIFQQIASNIGDARLFTVAIGAAPNNYFMNKAAMFGRGTYTHISKLSQVDESMSELFTKISSPALTDIALDWKNPVAQNPSTIPDLYQGEPVILTAKLAQKQTSFNISGLVNDSNSWNSQLSMQSDGQSNGISRLWARNQVEELTDSLMLGGDHEMLKDQIIELGLKHHLVTEFTALVAVDKTPDLSRMQQAQAAQDAPYPQGSLGWLMQLLFGLAILLLGMRLYTRQQFS
ncbi:VIT domain-containing protein [Marinicella sp. W31]|uniref:VIT domain-containing protein n=1 Tax=Marinicella sp. W31 TaxID=3023713 RepID=UPI0037581E69